MPNRYRRATGAATTVAAVLATGLAAATAQAADDVVAELRVVGPGGQLLEQGTSYVTNTESIRTDPDALCFIEGEGGSGDRIRLPGPTAMGMIKTAGDANRQLNPLSTTDEFGFGLGLCGIGDVTADTSDYWALTLNHQASQVGGDQVRLRQGDDVLWSLTEFPPDPELELTAAPGASPGGLDVAVERWVCSTDFPPPDPVCLSEPADGAMVTGGAAPAVADDAGVAEVSLPAEGRALLQATQAAHLDSNVARVCVSMQAGECPAPTDPPGRRIVGRRQADRFKATAGWDVVRARGGADRIDLGDGGADKVNCGGGRDRVIVDGGADDSVAGNCERVKTLSR